MSKHYIGERLDWNTVQVMDNYLGYFEAHWQSYGIRHKIKLKIIEPKLVNADRPNKFVCDPEKIAKGEIMEFGNWRSEATVIEILA